MDETNQEVVIPRRILSALLTSLTAGVVPRAGAPYIAIGREAEVKALLSDLEKAADGGSSIRFVIGRYGSGKSFLLQLVRGYALERGFLTADADLSPERRLYGSGGSGLATYRELIRNLASRACPEGGALPTLISRWISGVRSRTAEEISPDSPEFEEACSRRIYAEVAQSETAVGGFDFAQVLRRCYRAGAEGDDEAKSACLRWLRGEYVSRTEARAALDIRVSEVINDDNWYDYLKLWAIFARAAGYRGLLVMLDECVNLYKITNRISRENNYEKLLAMYNDALQGRAPGMSMIFGGTPKFLEDTRRGLFSYEALRSRLCDSRFAAEGYYTMTSPVIRLKTMSGDELFALLVRLTHLYAKQYGEETPAVSEEQMTAFLTASLARAGADEMITPREIIRDYLSALDILRENPSLSFDTLIPPPPQEKKADDGQDTAMTDLEF